MTSQNIPRLAIIGLCCALVATVGCKKATSPPTEALVTFDIVHEVDGVPLQLDTILYQNAAGNHYDVTRLEYYLSYFNCMDNSGLGHKVDSICYINPRKPNSLSFHANLPTGSYSGIQFHIGLPAMKNTSYCLSNTPENINMAWPEMMGGGYHFMKFEGHYLDPLQEQKGFAMHLGMNPYLITVILNKPFQIQEGTNHIQLTMNLNEWFAHPHTYNFDMHGNYTMGVDSLMRKLSENGPSVFTLKQQP